MKHRQARYEAELRRRADAELERLTAPPSVPVPPPAAPKPSTPAPKAK